MPSRYRAETTEAIEHARQHAVGDMLRRTALRPPDRGEKQSAPAPLATEPPDQAAGRTGTGSDEPPTPKPRSGKAEYDESPGLLHTQTAGAFRRSWVGPVSLGVGTGPRVPRATGRLSWSQCELFGFCEELDAVR